MNTILKVQKVCKSFGKLSANADISFEVNQGEIFGIAGPNGAGKTTLFNVISGLPFKADSGQIFFQGEAIHKKAPHRIFQKGLARTFQRETVFSSLTVQENVEVAARYSLNLPRTELEEEALKALALVGLEVQVHDVADSLSLFDKKRLMLASALVSQPALLLLDEPASGLNGKEIGFFENLFKILNSKGITILLIEHVLPLLLSLSERLMILDHGLKLTEGKPNEVVNNPLVIEAYIGKGYRDGR
jgi:branched-chain amino acid transport system ATP-binding protein